MVSSFLVEFLLAEMCQFVTTSCSTATTTPASKTGSNSNSGGSTSNTNTDHLQSEMAAAKLERMGSSVGYRLTEQLAISKTWSSPSPTANPTEATAAQQLEAVKFLCKEVWSQIFEKQIDKLQTNHRGVFVLKDSGVRWLDSLQSGSEHSRVTAMLLLAFPCGIIRGSLSALGIPAAVSCDFLADGQAVSACSFNIKVK